MLTVSETEPEGELRPRLHAEVAPVHQSSPELVSSLSVSP